MNYKQYTLAMDNQKLFTFFTHKQVNPFRLYGFNPNYRFETKINAERRHIIIYDF